MNLKETGVVVILIGMFIFASGFILLMDKALMICGNILVSLGIIILSRSHLFNMLHMDKIQGVVMFIIGFFFILKGLTLLGFILEVFGLIVLLRQSIPSFRTILRGLIFGRVINKFK
ncbi:GOT1-like family protein [Vairimorpha necatrix]|uniref:GOT1-like family protein n=1 Tax=Vairimorpha necatrix TaxID=6039 RepID=A0AAX4JE82_9MICR